MNFSDTGLSRLKNLEGVRYKPYKDSGGKWTVGCGHLIQPGDGCSTTEIINTFKVDSLLKVDVQTAVDCVNKAVTTSLLQREFDALVIFTFNVGCGAFRKSTLLKLLNQGLNALASDQFGRWDIVDGQHSPGLHKRRMAERQIFLGEE